MIEHLLPAPITIPQMRNTSNESTPAALIPTPPAPNCECCVVIPVRDERDTLEDTLRALVHQIDQNGQPLDPGVYEIMVLANNCRDDSASLARRVSERYPHVALHVIELTLANHEAHVGKARRLLMDEAHRRLASLRRPRGIIATTDGDTRVSPTWIAATRADIRKGADAVGGRITVHPADFQALNEAGRIAHLRDVGYRSLVTELDARLDPNRDDPWPRHFQHFGASLAVTAETYLRAGRLPVQPWFEDVDFYAALMRIDARFRHSPAVRVTTSGRRSGRTAFGFAVQLTRWENMHLCAQPMCVESAGAVEARITTRRHLRRAWQLHRHGVSLSAELYRNLAAELDLGPGQLREALNQYSTFGMLVEQVEQFQRESGRWREQWPLVDIRDAISDLRYRLDDLRRSPSSVLFEEIQPVQSGSFSAQVL